jgi:hypothetical protein
VFVNCIIFSKKQPKNAVGAIHRIDDGEEYFYQFCVILLSRACIVHQGLGLCISPYVSAYYSLSFLTRNIYHTLCIGCFLCLSLL